jgi:hypothetical protein
MPEYFPPPFLIVGVVPPSRVPPCLLAVRNIADDGQKTVASADCRVLQIDLDSEERTIFLPLNTVKMPPLNVGSFAIRGSVEDIIMKRNCRWIGQS